jgi:hypothetical protein
MNNELNFDDFLQLKCWQCKEFEIRYLIILCKYNEDKPPNIKKFKFICSNCFNKTLRNFKKERGEKDDIIIINFTDMIEPIEIDWLCQSSKKLKKYKGSLIRLSILGDII